MKIIDRFKKHKHKRTSRFTDLNFPKCRYTYSQIYLGARSEVYLIDKDIELCFSYSAVDGISVKIKCNDHYRILFDYSDGAYFVNDENSRDYNGLLESLSLLKNTASEHNYLEIYEQLENIMYNFVINNL